MSPLTLDKVSEHKPIRDEVFLSLRDAILSGRFKPGERLVEKTLAQQLDLSRTPIREALRKLELEGLVAYAPRRGVIVVGVSPEDALEIYAIEAVLEGLAARLAANKRSDDELAVLQKLLAGMEECIQKDKIHKLTTLHGSFHNTIAEMSKSPRLYHMIVSLREHVKNFGEIPCFLPENLQTGWEQHRAIVEAIAQKDYDRAEQAAKDHLTQTKRSLLKSLFREKEVA